MLGLLWTIADHGEKGALLKIAKTLVPFVKALNGKLIAQPDLLGLWPQSLPSWPVTKSLHPLYDSEHESLLRELHVGDTLPMRVDGGARWKFDTIAKWSLHLYNEINRRRGWLCDDSDLSDDLRVKLSNIKEFSSENWEAWWNLAEDLLDYGYVDLVDIPELKKWATSPKDLKISAALRVSPATSEKSLQPGKIRSRIKNALRQKFKTLVGENKSR